MNWMDQQTPIDISDSLFPKFDHVKGGNPQRFWYIKDEFLAHSEDLLRRGNIFSMIHAYYSNGKWRCGFQSATIEERMFLINKLRLFYLKSENMSIYSFCRYMEKNVQYEQPQRFFKHMRKEWEEHLNSEVYFLGDSYEGSIRTNKQLIDTLLYSGTFHSQEKYKKRYDELLLYMDESLILKHTYNALHSGYQMTQISTAIKELREDNLVITLPNHLSHVWDKNCPYNFS
jgi:hypothetical protein